MGRPCGCGCCCGWVENIWPMDGEIVEMKTYVQSTSYDLTQVIDDGTTLSCGRRVRPEKSPCGQVAMQFASREPPVSTNCLYGVGMLQSGWTFTPDGAAHTIRGELDVAIRTYEVRYADGTLQPENFNDATIPTDPMLYPGTPLLLCRQGGTLYWRAIFSPSNRVNGNTGEINSGFIFTGLAAGDWYRELSGSLDAPVDLGGANWTRIEADDSGETGGQSLDLTDGADPLEFGWLIRYAMQWIIPTEPDSVRLASARATFRMDRLCLTIA